MNVERCVEVIVGCVEYTGLIRIKHFTKTPFTFPSTLAIRPILLHLTLKHGILIYCSSASTGWNYHPAASASGDARVAYRHALAYQRTRPGRRRISHGHVAGVCRAAISARGFGRAPIAVTARSTCWSAVTIGRTARDGEGGFGSGIVYRDRADGRRQWHWR